MCIHVYATMYQCIPYTTSMQCHVLHFGYAGIVSLISTDNIVCTVLVYRRRPVPTTLSRDSRDQTVATPPFMLHALILLLSIN